MKKRAKILWVFGLFCIVNIIPLSGQTLKEKAKEAFVSERYNLAISLIKEALKESPEDAELYYYLGFFSHHIAHESRPFIEPMDQWSEKEVIGNLEKALSLNPTYGDARYFIGAEYGARAMDAMMDSDIKRCRFEYEQGKGKGAYPDWMLELANNMLKSVLENGILFVQGDSEYHAIKYLQIVEGERMDVTVIPLTFLDRPWFIKMLRDGIGMIEREAPITLTDKHIMELRPYKWQNQFISMPIPAGLNKQYGIEGQVDTLVWYVEADLFTESERPYLSAKKSVFVHILETNAWQRPVFVSMGVGSLGSLDKFRMIHGCVYQLLPFDTEKNDLKIDVKSVESLYSKSSNFKDFKDVKEHDMPRVSFMLLNYHSVLLELAHYYYAKGEYKKGLKTMDRMAELFPQDIFPMPDYWIEHFGKFRQSLEEKIKNGD